MFSFDKFQSTITNIFTWSYLKGFHVLALKPASIHPDDHYLAIVLIDTNPNDILDVKSRYVTWRWNTDSMNNGRYFTSLRDAKVDFELR
ncbi:MAG: hypothetical protein GXY86_08130 [Firmicutes bacterium]|mgnify:CR=1 FL=1|nr:hypothetical protein [Bacillota bacterium]